MKRLFTLISALGLSIGAFAQSTYNVTFQVDMNQYSGSFTTPEVNGTFNNWCGNCNAMSDANMDGIWDVTLPITADSIEYKFSHDAWTGQENLTPGSSCTKTSGGFTNRFIELTGDTTLPVVCWESCMACGTAPDTSYVTFQVNMNQYTGSFTTPEVNGDFNNWCGNCNTMSDTNGDGIWEVTLPITADSIEYKFAHDNWSGQEELTAGSECTKTTGSFTNRFLVINGDVTLPAVCWGECSECTSDVTFRVDMIEYAGTYGSVNLNGTFNNWCGTCTPMTDDDNDSIFEVTVTVPAQATIEWKFTLDGWTAQEEFTEGDPCTMTTGGFTNRYMMTSADSTLPVFCYNACSECETRTLSVEEAEMENFSVYPNPASTVLYVDGIESNTNIKIVDILGKEVGMINTTNPIARLDISNLTEGVYILNIQTENISKSTRVIISH